MRVLCVIDRYRHGKGGLEAWVESLFQRLSDAGHEIHLASRDTSRPAGTFIHHGSLIHHGVPVRGITRSRRDRAFALAARDLARSGEYDVVLGLRHVLACDLYAPHGGSVAATWEARSRRRASSKWRMFLALERELLTGAAPPARILAVSGSVRRDLAERFPGVADRIRVVPNGVDLARFSPEGRTAGGGTLLFVAANPPLKGWRTARETFRRLRESGIAERLLVAGAHPGRLPRGVEYLGHVSRLEAVYRSADVLLSPTLYDPFPLSTLEALACGTAVATTRRNGAVEHLGDGGPVRAVSDPEDVGAFTDAVRELLAWPDPSGARRAAEGFPLEESLRAAEALLVEAATLARARR